MPLQQYPLLPACASTDDTQEVPYTPVCCRFKRRWSTPRLGSRRRYCTKLTGFEKSRGSGRLFGLFGAAPQAQPTDVRILTNFDPFSPIFRRARRARVARARRSVSESHRVSAPLRAMIHHRCPRASPGRWGSGRSRLEAVPVVSEHPRADRVGGPSKGPRRFRGGFDHLKI